MKISVIIPIYNVEDYLSQCIESVLYQSYKNIEVILVNDGSTDNSPQICSMFEKNDNRVVVIHKGNSGLSDARNTGIYTSKGDYLIFLDSDDYWNSSDCLEHIVNCIHESHADVLVFGYNKFYENSKRFTSKSHIGNRDYVAKKPKAKAFDYLIKNDLYIASACSKVIKRDLITKNSIYFEKGVTSEDIEWSARIAIAAESFDYYPGNFYIYRQRLGSITRSLKAENVIRLKENIDLCINYGNTIADVSFYKSYMSYVAYYYTILLANAFLLKNKERKYFLDDILENAYLIDYGKNKKVKAIQLVKTLFGFRIMCFLLHKYFFWRHKY